MKKWPKDGSTVSFRDLIQPVREAIEFAYEMKRKNKNRTVPWKGYNVGKETLVSDFAPDEKLKAGNLRYNLESQGRDALDMILGIAVQLGFEQGKRLHLTDTVTILEDITNELKISNLEAKIKALEGK